MRLGFLQKFVNKKNNCFFKGCFRAKPRLNSVFRAF
jgi:hypothetical protein